MEDGEAIERPVTPPSRAGKSQYTLESPEVVTGEGGWERGRQEVVDEQLDEDDGMQDVPVDGADGEQPAQNGDQATPDDEAGVPEPAQDEAAAASEQHEASAEQPDAAAVPAAAPAAPTPTSTVTVPTRGPTSLQKIVSLTRQRDLPPKNREEEKKHLAQLSEMLASSHLLTNRRAQALEARRATRAAVLARALPTWEKQILPAWRVVLPPPASATPREVATSRELRRLWWDGTMPSRHRGRLWALCIGNALALGGGKASYERARERGEKRLKAGEDGAKFEIELEKEMDDCFWTSKLFRKKGGVMRDDLRGVLCAFLGMAGAGLPEVRYPAGIAYPAALLLINLPPPEAFHSLLNLVHKSFLSAFYTLSPSAAPEASRKAAYYRIWETLLADEYPKIYSNFLASSLQPAEYLSPWISTLFASQLALDTSTRIMDVFLLEGDSVPFRIALVMIGLLESRLLNNDKNELMDVFLGRDKGATKLVLRDKGLLTPPTTTASTFPSSSSRRMSKTATGMSSSTSTSTLQSSAAVSPSVSRDSPELQRADSATSSEPGQPPELQEEQEDEAEQGEQGEDEEDEDAKRVLEQEDVFEEMGCTEDTVFARLLTLEWKEETWLRLVDRELPEADE